MEAFVRLTAFAETARRAARAAGVKVGTEERFGFGAFTHTGPAPDRIAAVWRARLGAQVVLEALLEAGPESLLSFQASVSGGGAANDGDPPKPDKRTAAKESGLIASDTFCVEFVGHTVALRDFLNALAQADEALVVRSVEVEPAALKERVAVPDLDLRSAVGAGGLRKFSVVV